jgi:hypothetical protein
MPVWQLGRRTQSKAFVYTEIEPPDGAAQPLVPHQDYLRIRLCEMFLGTRSTLAATWLPAAHITVTTTGSGGRSAEYSKVFKPDRETMSEGVTLNYPITDLIPYTGGVVEIEAVLLAWEQTNRVEMALDVLQSISALPIPPIAPALAIAQQVTSAAKTLFTKADGSVHLRLHQAFVSSPPGGQAGAGAGPVLRPGYHAVLLADQDHVDPGSLRVVGNQLHQVGQGGADRHLLGWDFLLLGIEGRSQLDDFWLPELQDYLDQAVRAHLAGKSGIASQFRDAAKAAAWQSPVFNWMDRDRVIRAIDARFDDIADDSSLGAAPGGKQLSLTDIVRLYGPSVSEVRARGEMTEAIAFASRP